MYRIKKFLGKEYERMNQIIDSFNSMESSYINLEACCSCPYESVLEAQKAPVFILPTEGVPGNRYFPNMESIEEIDVYSEELILKLFDLSENTYKATTQPHSGTQANQIVYNAVLKDGDIILSLDAKSGGHISHNKFGKDITAQKGRVPNIVFGYDKIPDERYTLKINEEEAKIVKEIFESYVYKGIGTTKISWDLNDRGIRTKKTKSKWVQTSIVRMLKNQIYTGRVTNKKSEVTDFITGTRKDLPEEEWIVVERPEMRIISDELFNRAQEILAQRSNEFKLNNKREKTEYVFSTLIYCKHCGYSFRRMKRKYTTDGKEYIRWVCSGRNSMGVNHCPNATTIDEEELLNNLKKDQERLLKSIETMKKNKIIFSKDNLAELFSYINIDFNKSSFGCIEKYL